MTGYLLAAATLLSSFLLASAQNGQTPWTPWSTCPVSCGGGSQERFRDCFDGNLCSLGRLTENRNCGTSRCPVHGGWELWESWTSCTVTCGGGRSSRERSCDAPVPDFGGRFCLGGNPANIDIDGVEWEWKDCNTQPCVVDGAWSLWTEWSSCSSTCNNGMAERNRTCTNPPPAHGGLPCHGTDLESKRCNVHIQCPIDGGFTPWSEWNYCSSSCVGGVQLRTRTCTAPFPLYGGKECVGAHVSNKTCNEHVPCPVNGEWQEWSLWSACSSTCKGGKISRQRECSTPLHGGFICLEGSGSESQPCNDLVACPVHGNWAVWSLWSECSSTCAGGTRTRERTCTNPVPSLDGLHCTGETVEIGYCNENIGCPLNGQWSTWSLWDLCTSPCGGGQQSRTRACTAPAPAFGGIYCDGSEVETIDCNLDVPC
ncbi:coadhesin-like [Watersipora subatra]|uniref:coadhesin-like n=1 Tax=Watersipora subatra TaxID=2589382 RepID=UPI00355B99D2